MRYAEMSCDTNQRSVISGFFRLLEIVTSATSRRNRVNLQSMPDDLLDDIGLSRDDRFSDLRDINLMNASIRSGIILPRPC